MLTGKTPFDSKELLQAGLDEMRRTICEKEPPTPSMRGGRTSFAAMDARGVMLETRFGKGMILLMEDSAADAEVILMALERSWLAEPMAWVRSGEEALAYCMGQLARVSRVGH